MTVTSPSLMARPLQSLKNGDWVKLICGASYQDLPSIRNLALVYSLVGVDCIDCAADLAVVHAVRDGISAALAVNSSYSPPWVMVSVNDGEDPHFRKAVFDPQHCPLDCSRPCESICPAQAIAIHGVEVSKCYGCGRCLPVCPLGLIETQSQQVQPEQIQPWLAHGLIDAIELHTQVGHDLEFQHLWQAIAPWSDQLKILAVSCPAQAGVIDYLQFIYKTMAPLAIPLIWQTDGRPMSGDIGKGTTHAAIRFAQEVLASDLPGFVQLAGGTNDHTVKKLAELGLLAPAAKAIDGIAYGSFARRLLTPILNSSPIDDRLSWNESSHLPIKLEEHPGLLTQAIAVARPLVNSVKGIMTPETD